MRSPNYLQSAVPLLSLLFSAAGVHAAVYSGSAHEGFNYTAGLTMDNTFSGGTGWNATGDSSSANTTNWGVNSPLGGVFTASGSRAITTGGLSYSNPAFPGGAGNALLVSGAGQIGRSLGQTVDSGTLYFSYLTQKTVDQLRTVNFSLFGSNERLAIGQVANNSNTRNQDGTWLAGANANTGNFSVLLSNIANSPVAAPADPLSFNGVYTANNQVSHAVNQTFLVVGRIDFNVNATALDHFTLYLNPGDLAVESNVTPYLFLDHVDLGSIDGFRTFAGATQTNQTVGSQTGLTFTAAAAVFDEVRFGSSYAQVVPEPGSAAMLILTAPALLIRRRQQNRFSPLRKQ